MGSGAPASVAGAAQGGGGVCGVRGPSVLYCCCCYCGGGGGGVLGSAETDSNLSSMYPSLTCPSCYAVLQESAGGQESDMD